jgi:molecular chaperone GrpE
MSKDKTKTEAQAASDVDAVAELDDSQTETDALPTDAMADNMVIIAQLETELANERARADELMDKAQRMAAEFQNSRRRQEKQLAEEIDRAGAHLVRRLLPIVDDFDLAFTNVPAELATGSAWVDGFLQIQKKLHALLEEEGVAPMAREGEFDPALHEAVTSEASDSVPSGNIIGTLRTGYTHRGRVLRPALVRVAL